MVNLGSFVGALSASGKSKFHIKCEDFDAYRHLNNARFPVYFDDAREHIFISMGLGQKFLVERGIRLVAVNAHYEYKNQVREGKIEIFTSVEIPERGLKISVIQEMSYNGAIAATSRAEYCFINSEKEKVVHKHASEIIKEITQGFNSQVSVQ